MQSRKRYEMINFRCESMHAHTHTDKSTQIRT